MQEPKIKEAEFSTVDRKANIITDVFVTANNVSDTMPYVNRIKEQMEDYGFKVKQVGSDAGYNTPYIFKELYKIGILASVSHWGNRDVKGKSKKCKFNYIPECDVYICLQKIYLECRSTNQEGYREYQAQKDCCQNCARKKNCLTPKQKIRTRYDVYMRTTKSFTTSTR